jgi:DMSO reductase anchor subunit
VQALPLAAFFLFLETAVGGVIALFLVHLRGEVSRGFSLFTGWGCWLCLAVALWLRVAFPPAVGGLDRMAEVWFAAERALTIAFALLLGIYLLALQVERTGAVQVLGPIVPLVGLGALWCASLVEPSAQLGGLGAPFAVLAGSLSLGSVVAGLSLGHWYLVAPTLSVRPLIRLTFLCLGAIVAQLVLLPGLLLVAGAAAPRVPSLFSEHALFFSVRVVFGLLVPLAVTVMVWRTARIRSLDSATGLLYIAAALILAGEISARTLYFLTGVAT